MEPEHIVTPVPIEKMDGGIIGYFFVCTCGRVGNGRHNTPDQAFERGHDHIKEPTE